jgi:hypothetical protein
MVDVATLETTATLTGHDYSCVAYAGPRLLAFYYLPSDAYQAHPAIDVYDREGTDLVFKNSVASDCTWRHANRDGTWAVFICGDNSVELLELDTGQRIARLDPRSASSLDHVGVGFGPSGAQVVTFEDSGYDEKANSESAIVSNYDLSPASVATAVCAVADIDLDPADWERYVPGVERPTLNC